VLVVVAYAYAHAGTPAPRKRIGPTLERPAALNARTLDARMRFAVETPPLGVVGELVFTILERQSRVAAIWHLRQCDERPKCIRRLRGKSSSGSHSEQFEQRLYVGGEITGTTCSGESLFRENLLRGSRSVPVFEATPAPRGLSKAAYDAAWTRGIWRTK
jgi:hypothetical protein